MIITIGTTTLDVELYDNPASRSLRKTLPQEIRMSSWGDEYYGEEKIVDVNIRRLRMKIEEEPSEPKHIITVWGRGYKWNSVV